MARARTAKGGAGGGKYRVAPKERRTWRGRVYDSRAEMLYAQVLDLLMRDEGDGGDGGGGIVEVIEQPRVVLDARGAFVYRPDFGVRHGDGTTV